MVDRERHDYWINKYQTLHLPMAIKIANKGLLKTDAEYEKLYNVELRNTFVPILYSVWSIRPNIRNLDDWEEVRMVVGDILYGDTMSTGIPFDNNRYNIIEMPRPKRSEVWLSTRLIANYSKNPKPYSIHYRLQGDDDERVYSFRSKKMALTIAIRIILHDKSPSNLRNNDIQQIRARLETLKRGNRIGFDHLPQEMQTQIGSHLSSEALANLSKTSRGSADLIRDRRYWVNYYVKLNAPEVIPFLDLPGSVRDLTSLANLYMYRSGDIPILHEIENLPILFPPPTTLHQFLDYQEFVAFLLSIDSVIHVDISANELIPGTNPHVKSGYIGYSFATSSHYMNIGRGDEVISKSEYIRIMILIVMKTISRPNAFIFSYLVTTFNQIKDGYERLLRKYTM